MGETLEKETVDVQLWNQRRWVDFILILYCTNASHVMFFRGKGVVNEGVTLRESYNILNKWNITIWSLTCSYVLEYCSY